LPQNHENQFFDQNSQQSTISYNNISDNLPDKPFKRLIVAILTGPLDNTSPLSGLFCDVCGVLGRNLNFYYWRRFLRKILLRGEGVLWLPTPIEYCFYYRTHGPVDYRSMSSVNFYRTVTPNIGSPPGP
jgi:hypothetical protein